MKAIIWDLDGTLVDSYEAILEVLAMIYKKHGVHFSKDFVKDFILDTSIWYLLETLALGYALDEDALKDFFVEEQTKRDDMIQLSPETKAILEYTKEKDIQNFIYTHKGASTHQVLENLGIADYFTEVLTAASGFKRKPDPEALIYLMDKYQLSPQDTCYVGDRKLDVKAATNAGIQSFNLLIDDSDNNIKITSLLDLKNYL